MDPNVVVRKQKKNVSGVCYVPVSTYARTAHIIRARQRFSIFVRRKYSTLIILSSYPAKIQDPRVCVVKIYRIKLVLIVSSAIVCHLLRCAVRAAACLCPQTGAHLSPHNVSTSARTVAACSLTPTFHTLVYYLNY